MIYRSESERLRKRREEDALIAEKAENNRRRYPGWDELSPWQKLDMVLDDPVAGPVFMSDFDREMRVSFLRVPRWLSGLEGYNRIFGRYWRVVDSLRGRLMVLGILVGVVLYLLPVILLGYAVYGAALWLLEVGVVALVAGAVVLGELVYMAYRWLSIDTYAEVNT